MGSGVSDEIPDNQKVTGKTFAADVNDDAKLIIGSLLDFIGDFGVVLF